MNFALLDTHRRSALNLYRQREGLLRMWRTPLLGMVRLEERLLLHLYALANGDVEEGAPPRRAPEAFVAIACKLMRSEPDALHQACSLADSTPALTSAIFEALALMPLDSASWLDAYEAWPGLRPQLLELARRCGIHAEQALVVASELQHRDPALQSAAIRYAAERPEFGKENLRPYYASSRPTVPEAVRVAALWGGLLRGDAAAREALSAALQVSNEPACRRAILRLQALSGEVAHLPILREFARQEPVEGMRLLALSGRAEVVPDLLQAMERAPTAGAAGQAWAWLTGGEPPRKARLGLVGADGVGAGDIPDALATRQLWASMSGTWPIEKRCIGGEVMDLRGLVLAACNWAGRDGADALALLALDTTGKTNLDPFGWHQRRLAQLEALGVSKQPHLPDDLYERNPWEHGHYA